MKRISKRIVALLLLVAMMVLMASCSFSQTLSKILPNLNLSDKTDGYSTDSPYLIDGVIFHYKNGQRIKFRDEFVTIDGKTYFVFENRVLTGLYVIDDSIYCFDYNGEMIVGEHDGYTFGEDGRLIGNLILVDASAVREYNVPTAIMEEDFIKTILNPMLENYERLVETYLIPDASEMGITVTEEDYVFDSKDVWGYQNSRGKWFYEDKYDEYGNLRFDALIAYLNYLESITNAVYPISTNATTPRRIDLVSINRALVTISTSFTLVDPANTAAYGKDGYAVRLKESVNYYTENPGSTQAIYVCAKTITDGHAAALENLHNNLAKYAGYTEEMRADHENKCMMQYSANSLEEPATYCLVNNRILRSESSNSDVIIKIDGIEYSFDYTGKLIKDTTNDEPTRYPVT